MEVHLIQSRFDCIQYTFHDHFKGINDNYVCDFSPILLFISALILTPRKMAASQNIFSPIDYLQYNKIIISQKTLSNTYKPLSLQSI